MLEELHSQGKTVEDMAECLKGTPLDQHIIAAIKAAHALGCELRIISDANLFYIETILEHHGVWGCFSRIDTNPSFVNEEGRLRILPFHDLNSTPHGCKLCPPNMCKGLVIDQIQASVSDSGKKRIIYLGDGNGDYCPTLKLGENDFVMPRKNYPLWKHIHGKPKLIKAKVHEWSTGEELERILLHLIDTIPIQDKISSSNTSQSN
ncbi:thiamine phosphate phosphatase-like protein isoform X3 [Quercus lobata]|nr:thiamine phosphate phosphatase-like protein isoform X3 [Quercus lobata]XP_030953124.1 thiamine phosphate phosphatase-like protein isoform X3 [Quercus lobata]